MGRLLDDVKYNLIEQAPMFEEGILYLTIVFQAAMKAANKKEYLELGSFDTIQDINNNEELDKKIEVYKRAKDFVHFDTSYAELEEEFGQELAEELFDVIPNCPIHDFQYKMTLGRLGLLWTKDGKILTSKL